MSERKNEMRIWKNKLYNLQLEAPDPIPVYASAMQPSCPPYYGLYYHGRISRETTEELLSNQPSGAYLIRDSLNSDACFTLAMRFDQETKNYKLYYDSVKQQHYVGEKMFDNVYSLVKDGLIHLHIEKEGQDVLLEMTENSIYERTPYRKRYQLVTPMNKFTKYEENDSRTSNHINPHRPLREIPLVPPHARKSVLLKGQQTPISIQKRTTSLASDNSIDSAVELDSSELANSVSYKSQDASATQPVHKTNLQTLQERYNLPPACLVEDECGSTLDRLDNLHTLNHSRHAEEALKTLPSKDVQQSFSVSPPLPAVKAHVFKLHTFMGANWCDYCNNFLWGLKAQGYRCTDCGFQAHKRCADCAHPDCLPTMKYMRRVFAVDLISLVRAEKGRVPIVMQKCIGEIERRGGLQWEGLYRIPGNRDHVEELRKAFDKNADAVDLVSEDRVSDLNVLTSLVKLFMRQLPNPVIPYDFYDRFIAVAKKEDIDVSVKIAEYRDLVHKMPLEHYDLLKYFLAHANKITLQSSVNMMTSENLSIVLAPSLIASSYSDPVSCLASAKFEQAVVECLIGRFHYVFPMQINEVPLATVNSDTLATSANHSNKQASTDNGNGDLCDDANDPTVNYDEAAQENLDDGLEKFTLDEHIRESGSGTPVH